MDKKYSSCFDKKNNTDARVVIVFQEQILALRKLSPTEINGVVNEIFAEEDCVKYLTDLIKVILVINNGIIFRPVAAPRPPAPISSIMFFKKLLEKLSHNICLDPFLFAQKRPPGIKLLNMKESLSIIKQCIYESIASCSFMEEALAHYLPQITTNAPDMGNDVHGVPFRQMADESGSFVGEDLSDLSLNDFENDEDEEYFNHKKLLNEESVAARSISKSIDENIPEKIAYIPYKDENNSDNVSQQKFKNKVKIINLNDI